MRGAERSGAEGAGRGAGDRSTEAEPGGGQGRAGAGSPASASPRLPRSLPPRAAPRSRAGQGMAAAHVSAAPAQRRGWGARSRPGPAESERGEAAEQSGDWRQPQPEPEPEADERRRAAAAAVEAPAPKENAWTRRRAARDGGDTDTAETAGLRDPGAAPCERPGGPGALLASPGCCSPGRAGPGEREGARERAVAAGRGAGNGQLPSGGPVRRGWLLGALRGPAGSPCALWFCAFSGCLFSIVQPLLGPPLGFAFHAVRVAEARRGSTWRGFAGAEDSKRLWGARVARV